MRVSRSVSDLGAGVVGERVGERLERALGVRHGALDVLQLLLRGVDVGVLGQHVAVVRRLRPPPHRPVPHAHALHTDTLR